MYKYEKNKIFDVFGVRFSNKREIEVILKEYDMT